MPSGPQSWNVFTAARDLVQSELLVNSVSPLSIFDSEDATKYGATNAIYIGRPKDFNIGYTRQCHVIPFISENVARHAFGGKVWDEGYVYLRLIYDNRTNWYQALQDIVEARDVMHQMITRHSELPNAPTVNASKGASSGGNAPLGYHFTEDLGTDWVCWGFLWWMKQEWTVAGGIIS